MSERKRERSPSTRATLICLAGLALSVTGCGSGPHDSNATVERSRVVPIVSVANLENESVGWRRWVDVKGVRTPAIIGREDFSFSVPIDGKETLLRGGFGFLGGGNAATQRRATFRITLSRAGGSADRVLFDETLASSGAPSLSELDLSFNPSTEDGTSNEALTLVFDLEFETSDAASGLVAGWFEPVIEVRTAVQLPEAVVRPNVLLITADTTRQDHLSSYNGPARTPALEGLAADGILFTNAYSMAYGTTPSHASLLTGSYARSHGVYDNDTILGPEQVTLSEVLQEHGFSTAAFVSAEPLTRRLGLDQGFDLYDDVLISDDASGLGMFSDWERRADVTASRFLHWLRARGDAQMPFLAWVHFYDAHQPYAPPATMSANAASQGAWDETKQIFETPDGQPKYIVAEQMDQLAPWTLELVGQVAKERYDLEIEFMDRQIASILQGLRDSGLYSTTLIVFVADHGEFFLERGRRAFNHSGLNVETTRLPLILKLPAAMGITWKSRVDFMAGNIDIAPTILDALDVEAPSEWTGSSFFPALARGTPNEFRGHVLLEGANRHALAVRNKRWAYRRVASPYAERANILEYLGYEPGRPAELYDLDVDPEELDPVEIDHDTAAIVEELESIIEDFLANGSRSEGEKLISPEHREALEALGYTR